MAERARELGGGEARGVGVALHFAQRDRAFGEAPVGVEDGIVGILPALLHEALRRAAVVFDEAVAVDVAVTFDPCERGLDVGPDGFDERDDRPCAGSTRRQA